MAYLFMVKVLDTDLWGLRKVFCSEVMRSYKKKYPYLKLYRLK